MSKFPFQKAHNRQRTRTGVKVQSLTLTTNHSEKTSANHFSETNTKLVEMKFLFVNSREGHVGRPLRAATRHQ